MKIFTNRAAGYIAPFQRTPSQALRASSPKGGAKNISAVRMPLPLGEAAAESQTKQKEETLVETFPLCI